jgi:hypothetical protein
MADTGPDADREASSVRRRTLLTSTAAAATTGALAPVASARAASVPADGRPTAVGEDSGTVARLLTVAEGDRDLDWIKAALQVAVQLELCTIPPYLCGWWSVKDRGGQAARLIRRVVDDEMYHLGVVCNLLVAVGGQPRIQDGAPRYPGPLPGGVRGGVTVYLSGLTRSYVQEVMMAIEAPDAPLARGDGTSPTIGSFYTGIQGAFRAVAPGLSADRQMSSRLGSDELVPMRTLDDVERALDTVKEQGEGTAASPADAFGDDQPAHYYAFGEIYHGRVLQKTGATWQYSGDPVPFPNTRPMAKVPPEGWPDAAPQVGDLLERFDATYHSVLASLDTAWAGGGRRSMDAAVHAMRGLEPAAVQLMETAIPGTTTTYGPLFRPPPGS